MSRADITSSSREVPSCNGFNERSQNRGSLSLNSALETIVTIGEKGSEE